MSDLDQILARYGATIARDATTIIANDIYAIMDNDEQFVSVPQTAEPPVDTMAVLPLSKTTIGIKTDLGAPDPEKARFRTGEMFGSLHFTSVGLNGEIGLMDDDVEKVMMQQYGGANINEGWEDTPPRPFMGVSTRAYEKIQERLSIVSEGIVAELEKYTLEPIEG